MHNGMSWRQAMAWAFAAGTVPAVMICAKLGWTWVLAGSAGAAAVYVLYWALQRKTGTAGLTASVTAAFGTAAGKAVLTLTAVWTILAAGRAIAISERAFPEDTTHILTAISVTALAALSGGKGQRVTARCTAVLAMGLAALYGLLVVMAARYVKLRWCAPWGTWRQGLTAFGAMLTPSAVLLVAPERREAAKFPAAVWLLLAVPAALAVVTAGCISPQIAAQEQIAFYTMAKSVRLSTVMERLEPLVSAALYLGVFSLVSLLTQAGANAAAAAVQTEKKKRLTVIICLLSFAAAWPAARIPETIWIGGSAVFWGILPLATQAVVALKKVGKNRKKGVDKREMRGYNDQAF